MRAKSKRQKNQQAKVRKAIGALASAAAVPGAGRGRPTDYRTEFDELVARLALLGLTDQELAGVFGVALSTFNEWKNAHPAFLEKLREGRGHADARVVESLFRRALGYEHEAVKIFNNDGAALVVPYVEHYPPDSTACIFWLKNRQPALWREKADVHHTGRVEVPGLPNDVLAIMRKLARERAKKG